MTGHEEEGYLVRAVAADYYDDTPRLVAADWYDEHDDPTRAAFIRAHVALARVEAVMFSSDTLIEHTPDRWQRVIPAEYNGAYNRFAAASRPYEAEPTRLVLPGGPPVVRLWFSSPESPDLPSHLLAQEQATRAWAVVARGFVANLTCPAEYWEAHADALCARHPLKQVWLTTPPAAIRSGTLGPWDWFELEMKRRSGLMVHPPLNRSA